MSGLTNKRQQVRNEKFLHDLVQNVPGNNFCADCHARNPAWASWSLGVFLCMRCASIHRKLGTHISKVKSLSMDSWTNEQVDNMRKVGNITSNKVYNHQSKIPPTPVDADETDAAMERFIRQKYVSNTMPTKRHTRRSSESDESPPPLPPKTPARFGLRTATSLLHLGSRARRQVAPATEVRTDYPRASLRPSKASQVFGASMGFEDAGDVEGKLSRLRDMGFTDDQRNSTVLRGVNGNMERAIEALVRLGEGDRRSPRSSALSRDDAASAHRYFAPSNPPRPSGASLTTLARPITPSPNNPFDIPPAQPQSSQSTGTLQNRNPYLSTNPFGPPQTDLALNQALQNLSLAASQPLFPHHTGGIPGSTATFGSQLTYQMAMTQQMQPMPQQQSYAGMACTSHMIYPQPGQQAVAAAASYNPFASSMQPMPQPMPQPQPNLSVNTGTFVGGLGNNPFTKSPTRMQSPGLAQIPEQAQQNVYTPPPQPGTNNPFFSPAAAMPPQPRSFSAQRPDKAAILALYNYPQLAPTPWQSPAAEQQSAPAAHQASVSPMQTTPAQHVALSGASPSPWSNNPFLASGPGPVDTPPRPVGGAERSTSTRGFSRDSMMVLGTDWMSGRHSPDAFASLSAKEAR